MAAGTVHKHFRLSGDKIRRAQRLLGASTQTEAIERALDELIAEHERRRIVKRAQDRFLRSGITLQDAYGKLEA
jgi:hypothetical protein